MSRASRSTLNPPMTFHTSRSSFSNRKIVVVPSNQFWISRPSLASHPQGGSAQRRSRSSWYWGIRRDSPYPTCVSFTHTIPSNRAVGFCSVSHVGDAVGHSRGGHLPFGLGPDCAERLPERWVDITTHQAFVVRVTMHGESSTSPFP